MIKFSCPHCKKSLRVKETLAGRRGPCPACKKMVVIPAQTMTPPGGTQVARPKKKPVRTADDLEAMAAEVLAPEPEPEQAPTEFVEFECPYCDEKVKVEAELAGKRTACPECRHIIRVPDLEPTGPRDWRRPETQKGPSGARRDDAELEGAWGTETSRGHVSRQALIEAAVIKEPKTPWTLRLALLYGLAALLVLGAIGGGVYFYFGYSWSSLEQSAVQMAERAVAADAKPLPPALQAHLHGLLSDYYYLAGVEDQGRAKGVIALQQARLAAARIGDDLHRQLTIRRLLHRGLHWGVGAAELGEAFRLLPPGPCRYLTVGELARAALVRDPASAPQLIQEMIHRGVQTVAGDGQTPSNRVDEVDRLNCLGVLGLELVRCGQTTPARQLVQSAAAKVDLEQGVPVHFLALQSALQMPLPKTEDIHQESVLAAQVEGQARTAAWPTSRQVLDAQLTEPSETHLEAILDFAAVLIDRGAAEEAWQRLEQGALPILEHFPGQLPWHRFRLVELTVAAGKVDKAEQLIASQLSPLIQDEGRLALLRASLDQTDGPCDFGDRHVTTMQPNGAAQALAIAWIARHNARLDPAATMEQIEQEVSDRLRPFAGVGVALGMRDSLQE